MKLWSDCHRESLDRRRQLYSDEGVLRRMNRARSATKVGRSMRESLLISVRSKRVVGLIALALCDVMSAVKAWLRNER